MKYVNFLSAVVILKLKQMLHRTYHCWLDCEALQMQKQSLNLRSLKLQTKLQYLTSWEWQCVGRPCSHTACCGKSMMEWGCSVEALCRSWFASSSHAFPHISALHIWLQHSRAEQRDECCWGSFATWRPGLAEGLGRPCLWQSHCLKLQEISWATAAARHWYGSFPKFTAGLRSGSWVPVLWWPWQAGVFIPAECCRAGGGDGKRLQCCVVRDAWGAVGGGGRG